MIFALPHQIIACVAVLLCYNSNNISLTKFDVRTAQKQSTLVPVSTLVNNASEDAPGRGCTFPGNVECASPENLDDVSSANSADSAAFASSAYSAGSADGADGADAKGDGNTRSGGGGHEEGNAHASEKHGIRQSPMQLFAVACIFVLIQSVLHAGGRQMSFAYLASFYNNSFAKFYVVASLFLAVGMYLVFTLDCEGMYHYVARFT